MSWVNLFVVTGSGAEGIYSAHADGRPVAIMSGDGQALVGIVNGVALRRRQPHTRPCPVALATNPMAATWTVAKIGMDIRDFRKLSLSDAISIVGNGFCHGGGSHQRECRRRGSTIPLLAIGAGLTIAGTLASFDRPYSGTRSRSQPPGSNRPLTHPTPTTPPPACGGKRRSARSSSTWTATAWKRSYTSGIFFDHDGDGFAEETGWVGKDDGLLVWDRNGNGQIDDGSELFGNNAYLPGGGRASTGLRRWRCSTATATAKSTPTTNASMN